VDQSAEAGVPSAKEAVAFPFSQSTAALADRMSERPPWSTQPVERPVPAMSTWTTA
jgi:hypothetical protein